MPLTAKGEEMKKNFTRQYGSEQGERAFYATLNKHKGEEWENKVHSTDARKGFRRAFRDNVAAGLSAGDALKVSLDAIMQRGALNRLRVSARDRRGRTPTQIIRDAMQPDLYDPDWVKMPAKPDTENVNK